MYIVGLDFVNTQHIDLKFKVEATAASVFAEIEAVRLQHANGDSAGQILVTDDYGMKISLAVANLQMVTHFLLDDQIGASVAMQVEMQRSQQAAASRAVLPVMPGQLVDAAGRPVGLNGGGHSRRN